jgi:uncharacterized protein YbaR (Trm112 family)
MVDPQLLKLLCCPETHQGLHLADEELLRQLNQKIVAGILQNRAGRAVSEKLGAGLLRDDDKVLYPIRNGIPAMLVDEGILLEGPGTAESQPHR